MFWITIFVDPKVRLAQFKAKQQEPVTIKCVHCRARKRKEYFQCKGTFVYCQRLKVGPLVEFCNRIFYCIIVYAYVIKSLSW